MTRTLPFYEAGTQFKSETPLTPEQAVRAAKLDFPVALAPIYHKYRTDPTATEGLAAIARTTEIKEWQACRREDTGLVMGIVKSTYKPLQNVDAFSFLNVVTESGEAIIRAGGAARGGALSWLYAQVPQNVSLEGDNDEQITIGFMVSNGHDGKRALRAMPILLRVATMTTVSGRALGKAVALRHSRNTTERVGEARQTLGVTFTSVERLQAVASVLIRNRYTAGDVETMLATLAPAEDESNVHPRVQERRDTIKAILYGSPTLAAHRYANGDVNGWAFYMAVCEYADYFAPYRESFRSSEAENRLLSVTQGDAWDLKDKALTLAM